MEILVKTLTERTVSGRGKNSKRGMLKAENLLIYFYKFVQFSRHSDCFLDIKR